jgi:hypothetical protein
MMGEIERVPVPKDRYLMFKMRLMQDAELLKVCDDPNVSNCIDLLVKAVDRHVNDSVTGIGKSRFKRKTKEDRAQFISLFKTKYYQHYDVEYSVKITNVDMKIIGDLSGKLKEVNSSFEEYITWWFDDLLPNNKNIKAPCFASLSSGHWIQQFKVANSSVIKKRKKKTDDKLLSSNALEKARELMRVYREKDRGRAKKEETDKIKALARYILDYTEQKISLEDFAVEVRKIERSC